MKKQLLLLIMLLAVVLSKAGATDAPITTAGTVVSYTSKAMLPITASNFTNIGTCNLRILFDPAIMSIDSIRTGPLLSPTYSTNLTVSGVIDIGWYAFPGVTLPGDPVLFKIYFSRISYGISPVTFSDNNPTPITCLYTDGDFNILNDLPQSSFYFDGSVTFAMRDAPLTIIDPVNACAGSQVCIPVKVTDFDDVGVISLTLLYNSSALTYQSYSNTSGYPGLNVQKPIAGTLTIGGYDPDAPGTTLSDNSTLVTLCFLFNGGTSNLEFYDNGTSCEYSGPFPDYEELNDSPENLYYTDGSITPTPIQWTGTNSTAWETQANWACGIIPVSTSSVIIPSGTPYSPLISSSIVVENLTVHSGTSVTIGPEGSLTVSNDLLNNAGVTGILVKSNGDGDGSLITNDAVNATVERYINSPWIDCCHGWHFISSPVSDQPIQPEFVSSTLPDDVVDLYKWDETGNIWRNSQSPTGWNPSFENSFEEGKGYLISYQFPVAKSFSGILNVSTINISNLTNNSSTANHGWNLLGNPFSSALKWNDGNWSLSSTIAATSKIWDEMSASYIDITSNGIIPAMNGFMVQVINPGSNGSLVIPSDARVHNSQEWYKSSENMILLLVTDLENNTAQQSIIKVNPNATDGYDAAYDSRFLSGYAPKFYSFHSNEMLSTNTIPEIGNDKEIEMVFVKNSASSFKISLNKEILIPGLRVFLTDRKTGIIQELSSNSIYNFEAEEGDELNRFKLHFKQSISIPESDNGERFEVITSKGKIMVITDQLISGTVRICDMSGRAMVQSAIGNSNSNVINCELNQGVYLITLISEKGCSSKKVVIKN